MSPVLIINQIYKNSVNMSIFIIIYSLLFYKFIAILDNEIIECHGDQAVVRCLLLCYPVTLRTLTVWPYIDCHIIKDTWIKFLKPNLDIIFTHTGNKEFWENPGKYNFLQHLLKGVKSI